MIELDWLLKFIIIVIENLAPIAKRRIFYKWILRNKKDLDIKRLKKYWLDLRLADYYIESHTGLDKYSDNKGEFDKHFDILSFDGPILKMKENPLPQWSHKKGRGDFSQLEHYLSKSELEAIDDFEERLDKITYIRLEMLNLGTVLNEDIINGTDDYMKYVAKMSKLWDEFCETMLKIRKRGNPIR